MKENKSPSPVSQKEKEGCYHCGERTIINPVYFDDKLFCCEGCKTVYSILKDNNMENYYALEENPGISLKNIKLSPQSYSVLDAPDVRDRLLSFQTADLAKVTLRLPNIHCASCLWLLENLYKMQPGIISSRVNFMKKTADITYRPEEVSLRQVAQLLAAIGYPPELNLGSLDGSTEKTSVNKKMLYRLGVAGFAFGNIMLMSFPDYLNIGASRDQVLKVFPYLNFVLTVPMVFYSGGDYLQSAWKGIKTRHLNMDVPIALGILAMFFWSTYEVFSGRGTGYFDSLSGLVFFLLLGKWFQDRTYRRIAFNRDYRSYFPIWATQIVDGEEVAVALDKLAKGDRILVRNGEMIPADGVIVKNTGLLDYSFVTGESEPVKAGAGEKVFAGGYQQGAAIEVELLTDVSQSYLTGLWNNEAFVKEKDRPASKLSDVAGRRFTYVVLLIAFLTLLYWMPRDWHTAVYAFTSVLIVACPCAISLSIPFTLGNVMSILGRKRIYLKNTMVIEDLAEITHIVFDKTGTLTRKGIHFFEGEALSKHHARLVKTLAMQSNHPVSRLLQKTLDVEPFGEIKDYKEKPGHGIFGVINGEKAGIYSGAFEGEKAGTVIEINGTIVARFQAMDELRPGVKELFDRLRKKYKLSLVSGDNAASQTVMEELFGQDATLLFGQKPEEKLAYIGQLQEKGEKVLMVGDGLNDAGALKKADVGAVLSQDTNNFTPASDLIMSVDQLPGLDHLLTIAKRSVGIIYKTYLFALVYNIVGLSFAVRAMLSPVIAAVLMPLSSITVVTMGVVMSTVLMRKMEKYI